jgi:hypothetical protein
LNRLFHVAAPAANQQQILSYRLLSHGDPDSAMRAAARLGRVFEFLQAPVEIAGIDRPDKGVDHRRHSLRLTRRDRPARHQRRGNRLHRPRRYPGLQPTGFVPWGRSRSAARRILPSARGGAAGCARGNAASQSGRRRKRARPPCASTLWTHQPAMPPRQASPSCASPSFAQPHCPTPLLGRPSTAVPCPCSPRFIWFRSGIRNTFHHNLAPADGLEGVGVYNAIVVITRWSMSLPQTSDVIRRNW